MDYKIIKTNRKTIAIQINEDLSVTVRAPRWTTNREIDRIVKEKELWIQRHIEKLSEKQEKNAVEPSDYLTNEEISKLADKALEFIPQRTAYFAKLMNVNYGRITIRNQRTRWGSCSAKGNLNFNCLLMLAPSEIIDYVIVHELCHRKEMNHSKAFWQEVEKVLPEYRTYEKWLKNEGSLIMRRLRAANCANPQETR